MKIHHRLRTKLIILFSIVTFIPALVTGIYAIQISSQTLRTQALTTQTIQAKTLANNITSFLTSVKGDLMFLSQSPVMKDYLNSNLSEAELKRQALEQQFLAFSRNRRKYLVTNFKVFWSPRFSNIPKYLKIHDSVLNC